MGDGTLFDLDHNHYQQFINEAGELDVAAVLAAGYNERQVEPIREYLIAGGRLKAEAITAPLAEEPTPLPAEGLEPAKAGKSGKWDR